MGWGLDEDVQRLTEVLIGPLLGSIPGILTLGLAAGIGEETLFRGALQPRFGLLITSLLFALLHSQYGITPFYACRVYRRDDTGTGTESVQYVYVRNSARVI